VPRDEYYGILTAAGDDRIGENQDPLAIAKLGEVLPSIREPRRLVIFVETKRWVRRPREGYYGIWSAAD
jgi:hypothetical protein